MKPHTLTLKIINDQDSLDSLSMIRPLSEPQKDLIRLIARTAVGEYIQAEKLNAKPPTQNRLLRLPEVVNLIGLSRSTIYAGVSKGTFPKPIHLGPRSIGWQESQIIAWLNERKNAKT